MYDIKLSIKTILYNIDGSCWKLKKISYFKMSRNVYSDGEKGPIPEILEMIWFDIVLVTKDMLVWFNSIMRSSEAGLNYIWNSYYFDL